jgi:hypothetical protein
MVGMLASGLCVLSCCLTSRNFDIDGSSQLATLTVYNRLDLCRRSVVKSKGLLFDSPFMEKDERSERRVSEV